VLSTDAVEKTDEELLEEAKQKRAADELAFEELCRESDGNIAFALGFGP
jgi:hypothetical protein